MAEPSAGFEIETEGFEELQRKMGKSREYVLGAMHKILQRCGQLLVPALKANTPEGATRQLRRYTVFQVLGTGEDMRLEVRQSARSSSGYAYGQAVRGGTRAHFPPYEALIPWVTAKLGVGGKEARNVAFLIARKISRVGTEPNPFHIKTFNQNKPKLEKIGKEELGRLVMRLTKQ